MAPRYAKRVDDNQRQIVRELRQIPGISVFVIGEPVDLLVGYQARNYLFEIKRADKIRRPSARTKNQVEFFQQWQGQVRYVSCTEDILHTLTSAYAHEAAKPDEIATAPDT